MTNQNQTKITMKIAKVLINGFNKRINDIKIIKRDAFLNEVLKNEIPFLEEEMKNKKLSSKAKKYISGELERFDIRYPTYNHDAKYFFIKDIKKFDLIGTETISVVVDKEVSEKLNKIVKEANMVRDAFFNRIFLFLLHPTRILPHHLPNAELYEDVKRDIFTEHTFFSQLREILKTPLFWFRKIIECYAKSGIYLYELPSGFDGFTCYLSDEDIPEKPKQITLSEEEINQLMELSFELAKEDKNE